jgi:hypothetical protein
MVDRSSGTKAMTKTADIIALLPLIGYFLLIFLFHALLPASATRFSRTNSPRQLLFRFLALGSLGITWYHMLRFIKWSYLSHSNSPNPSIESIAAWLRGTALFEQAWRIVCETPRRWWWSSQLVTYTAGVWTPFLWKSCMFPCFSGLY